MEELRGLLIRFWRVLDFAFLSFLFSLASLFEGWMSSHAIKIGMRFREEIKLW